MIAPIIHKSNGSTRIVAEDVRSGQTAWFLPGLLIDQPDMYLPYLILREHVIAQTTKTPSDLYTSS
jgi:hypothetical protein